MILVLGAGRRPGRSPRRLAACVVALLAAGCAAGPATKPAPSKAAGQAAGKVIRPAPEPPRARAVTDWESFSRTSAALNREIARREEELRSGPVAKRGQQLASRKLAASGRDLVDAGSLAGAETALQKAISLDGANGYAYLFLAYVHHVNGREDLASEFASSARRYLPPDEGARSELEGLALSIRAGSATAGD